MKLLTELPNLPIQQQPEILQDYHALVEKYPSHMFKIASYLKKTQIACHSSCIPEGALILHFGLTLHVEFILITFEVL